MPTLREVRTTTFAIVPSTDMTTPSVRLSGNGDTAAVDILDGFLKDLHGQLLVTNCSQVQVDLVELYFMNSACVRTFASWIHKVKTEGTPYRVHLKTNARQAWQRRSLEPIKRLAPNVVVLSADGQSTP